MHNVVYSKVLRDPQLIRGGGGATKWGNHWSKNLCAPPPQDRELFAPPASIWLKLQAHVLKQPQNVL